MKTVLDKSTREELIQRISKLTENSPRQWGKMNVYQMIRHCVLCEEMYLGKTLYKRVLIGRIFGKMGLKDILTNGFKKDLRTSSDFKVKETSGNVIAEKEKWISLVKEYENYSNDHFVHWFFGKMSKEQVGQFDYMHIDHHLRQFNC